jgi:CheY-like chemotaxis protein
MTRSLDDTAARQVLYVEDHPTNVQLMRAVFNRRPQLDLAVATNGQEARRTAVRLRPSLLLLDLRLPDCDGVALLAELRLLPGWSDIPAVAVTAEPAFSTDGTDFCEVWRKPLDLAFVLGRLDHFVSQPAAAPAVEAG